MTEPCVCGSLAPRFLTSTVAVLALAPDSRIVSVPSGTLTAPGAWLLESGSLDII
ncbi:hypothetical protein [Rhizobium leguminosarum]|uniref:hypothetical protein n=1 Tax=Rhizobium leguminosarum TaxID=384 RepID=UPI001FED917B|nr:hypothetical protein [Rhizobium leguminosarum]